MEGVALVTGAAGFIGANVVRRLTHDGLTVHVMLRDETDAWRLAEVPEVEAHRVSISHPSGVASLVESVRPKWVFHLAAYGAYSDQTDAARMTAVNTLGTFNLLDAVARTGGCEGFVHAGSSSEYGLKDHAPSEDEAVAPGSIYAITKCAATHGVTYWARAGRVPGATVRLYSVYGPWEQPTRLVPRLLTAARRGTLPPLVAPTSAHDFVWVDDAVDAIVRAARHAHEHPGAIWNVGSGVQTTLEELVTLARKLFGVETEPGWGSMAARPWDTDCWQANPARARVELDWEAVTSLDDGLQSFAQWLALCRERARYEP